MKSTCRRGVPVTAASCRPSDGERARAEVDRRRRARPSAARPGSSVATWPPGWGTTNVPFVEPQSATRTSQPWKRTSRWLRDTLSPSSLDPAQPWRAPGRSSRSGLRPISSSWSSSTSSPSSSCRRPRLGRGTWTIDAAPGRQELAAHRARRRRRRVGVAVAAQLGVDERAAAVAARRRRRRAAPRTPAAAA